jgi:signal peptidase II
MTIYLTAAGIFILDRLTKYAVLNSIESGRSVKVFDFFHISLVFNTGTAFGLFKNLNFFFIVVSAAVIALIALYAVRRRKTGFFYSVSLGLIMGGALGNLVDRIKFGSVVDFLDFRVWPVFNVADSAISIGIALLILNILRTTHNAQRKNSCQL